MDVKPRLPRVGAFPVIIKAGSEPAFIPTRSWHVFVAVALFN